jgi:hypothetical protein
VNDGFGELHSYVLDARIHGIDFACVKAELICAGKINVLAIQ